MSSGTSTHVGEAKLKDDIRIEYFRGERSKLRAYLMSVKLIHSLDPKKYDTETNKVLIAASYLRGDAQAWFEPYFTHHIEQDEDDKEAKKIFSSFAYYESKLRQVFGNVDEERVAARQIRQMRQQTSAAQYSARFQQLAGRLDWDDAALASAFYEGLSEAVKDQMGPNPPEAYKILMDAAIKTDGWLYERRMEKRGGRFYSGPRFVPNQGRRRDYGDPMDLDSTERGGFSRPNNRRPGRGNGGDKEREKRKRNNLCFECGKPGHRARECNNRAQGLHMMDDSAGTVGKKADTTVEDPKADWRGKAQKVTIAVTDEDTKIPSEETEYSDYVIAGHQETLAVLASIKVEDWNPEQQKKHHQLVRFFHDRIEEQEHAKVHWTVCYENDCFVHFAKKKQAEHFPRASSPTPSYERTRDQESLCTMEIGVRIVETGDLIDWETVEAEPEEESGYDSDYDDDVIGGGRTVAALVIQDDPSQVFILTNYWEVDRCNGCSAKPGKTHKHAYWNPETTPKELCRRLTLRACTLNVCLREHGRHTHQGPFQTVVPLPRQGEVLRHVHEVELATMDDEDEDLIDWDETINQAIWEEDSQSVVDETADINYLHARFYCVDTDCPQDAQHVHLFNIDPNYPDIRIPATLYQETINKGRTCVNQECPWRNDTHAHLPKNL